MPLGLLALASGGSASASRSSSSWASSPRWPPTSASPRRRRAGSSRATRSPSSSARSASRRHHPPPPQARARGPARAVHRGNALSAVAPTYELMMTGRVVAALCHGAFFGIGSVVAAALVAPEKAAGAIAIMFTGLTAANVLGVPFGTFLGQEFGWRSTFWVISAIGVVALVGIATLVPSLRADGPAPSLRRSSPRSASARCGSRSRSPCSASAACSARSPTSPTRSPR